MGEISYSRLGSNIVTTIHDDGSTTSLPDIEQFCDCCELKRLSLGGFAVKDVGGEVVMWLCSQCRG
jgi:hypothetical protein